MNPAATKTTLAASAASSVYGQSVTLTATVVQVAPATLKPAGGTVTFYDTAVRWASRSRWAQRKRPADFDAAGRRRLAYGPIQRRGQFCLEPEHCLAVEGGVGQNQGHADGLARFDHFRAVDNPHGDDQSRCARHGDAHRDGDLWNGTTNLGTVTLANGRRRAQPPLCPSASIRSP